MIQFVNTDNFHDWQREYQVACQKNTRCNGKRVFLFLRQHEQSAFVVQQAQLFCNDVVV